MYRVFIVEDESLIRKGIKNLIAWNEYGFSFAGEAQDGELAWPLIQKEKPDIVITDIRMPFMDGLELSSLIKTDMPDTTVIILSGFDDFTYAKRAIGIGVDEYLLKPLSKEQLMEVLLTVKEKKDNEQKKKGEIEKFSQEYFSGRHQALFKKFDAKKLDQRIVEQFLTNGLLKEIDLFLADYMQTLGEDFTKSIILRQYVVMQMQFTVTAFIDKLCVVKEKETVKSQLDLDMSISEAFSSRESAIYYSRLLLEKALYIRDQVANQKNNTMLHHVIEYMKSHFSEPEMDLTRAAQVAKVSTTYFSGIFSQQMGKTFVEYLTELRMQRAKELLRCTNKSSGEIAFEVGYKDSHYFSVLFKKVNGCSPRDYRMGGQSI